MLLCAILAVVGCADNDATVQLSVADSSGVRIASLSDSPWNSPVWAAIDTIASFQIHPDPAREETLFGSIRGALRFADQIVVLDAATSRLTVFDLQGRSIGAMGRRGQGPSELQSPWRLVRLPERRVAVVDLSGSMQIFPLNGDSAELLRLPRIGREPSPQVLDSYRDGSFLLISNSFIEEVHPGRNFLTSTMHHLSADGTAVDELGVHRDAFFDFDENRQQVITLFWAEPGMAAWSGGYVWCLTAQFRCDVKRLDGSTATSIRADMTTSAVSPRDIDNFRSGWLNQAASAADSIRIMNMLQVAVPLERFPVLSKAVVDDADRLWLSPLVHRVSDSTDWVVLQLDGTVLGRVSLPTDLEIWDLGADYVLGSRRDSSSAQYLVMYSYQPRGG